MSAPAPGASADAAPSAAERRAERDDDRTIGVLYADPADAVHRGSISGRISPAKSTGAPGLASGRDGRFRRASVAVDATSGAVVGATIGEWSCTAPGPVQFDGAYEMMVWR